jgi:prophage regulatory protein
MVKLLSKKQVRELVGLSSAQIDRLEKDGKFPKRVRIGFRVFWVQIEIEEWLEERIANRDNPTTNSL